MQSWQACPRCGAVVVLWRDPTFTPEVGSIVQAEWFVNPDGTQPENGDLMACPSCGLSEWTVEQSRPLGAGYDLMRERTQNLADPALRRWGERPTDEEPDATFRAPMQETHDGSR